MLLLIVVSGTLLLCTQHFLLDEITVVAAVLCELAERNLDRALHEIIEKTAIMRNQDYRMLISEKIIFQPLQCFEVKMVRRLIKQ